MKVTNCFCYLENGNWNVVCSIIRVTMTKPKKGTKSFMWPKTWICKFLFHLWSQALTSKHDVFKISYIQSALRSTKYFLTLTFWVGAVKMSLITSKPMFLWMVLCAICFHILNFEMQIKWQFAMLWQESIYM